MKPIETSRQARMLVPLKLQGTTTCMAVLSGDKPYYIYIYMYVNLNIDVTQTYNHVLPRRLHRSSGNSLAADLTAGEGPFIAACKEQLGRTSVKILSIKNSA